jgi:hypothetical protein
MKLLGKPALLAAVRFGKQDFYAVAKTLRLKARVGVITFAAKSSGRRISKLLSTNILRLLNET